MIASAASLAALIVSSAAELPESTVIWDKTFNLRGALGYKDNVLLRNFEKEGSAFWQGAFDFMAFRADVTPGASTFSFFGSFEDRRYFSSEELDKEQYALTQARWQKPLRSLYEIGAIAQYMYADQVYDASATEELLETLPVKSHNAQASIYGSRELSKALELELRFVGERQYFNEPLDDYWEMGPQLSLTKKYGHKSEAVLSYTFDHRLYDTRRQFGRDGRAIAGTSLEYNQHEFEGIINHSWVKSRHWRSRLRFLFEINDDNGPGYYNYHRYRLSKRFGYYGKDWEATVEGKILHYDYQHQRVPGGDSTRAVWEYAVGARVEKLVWKKLKVFAESEHEFVHSNYSLEEYDVNTVLAGVDWEF